MLLFFINVVTYSQEKIEKYCKVTITFKGFSDTKINVHYSIGSVDSLFSFKDATILSNLNKMKDLTTDVDVLNYMSSLKWSLIFFNQNTFIFKRVFDKSEIASK